MRKYLIYKTTGIDGVGSVPEHWKIIKLKYIAKIYNGQDQKDVLDENGKYPIYGSGGIFGYANQFLFEGPSVLLGRKGTVDKPRLVQTPFWSVDTAYYTKISKKVNTFIFYHLCNQINFDYYVYGSAIPSMTARDLNEIKFPLSPLPEQHAIVRFLDYKTGQIDSFIANRQKQIELLKEQKQYVLDKRITEGIFPEKGFQKIVHPYIKQIPVGWEFKKLAFLSKITRLAGYEYTLLWETQEDGEVIALRGQNVGFNEFKDIENAERISKELSLRLNRSKLYKGDIVFPCVGTVGKAVLIEEDNKYHINQNIAKITPKNEVDGLFLSLLLNSYYAYHQIIHFNTSDAQPNVLVRDLRRFMIPTPPYEEQKEIASVIVKELDTLNTIISKYQKQIDLMQEYRTSLISQAVTGKIDVRAWEPKKMNEAKSKICST